MDGWLYILYLFDYFYFQSVRILNVSVMTELQKIQRLCSFFLLSLSFFFDLRVHSSEKAKDGRMEETAAAEIKGSARSYGRVPTGLEES